ncbi:ROK family protein [Allonocardiopsis opalescens]|uniref:Putative NBD/HSP70 family sugar kinase n=1 Tax=Allonocardiopsis opalescens TaxID=1144618 RepID=A0A2T0Q6V2_9ACTN|nr:ROK family protein [Allonocardiopsis opalescens]PRX99557.1 putative NBD/HSP70 family sugar kinase [Allonocardiopsis opalescens]
MHSPRSAASRLLTLVHREGRISRSAATTRLGLSRSAIGLAIEALSELGMLRVASPAEPAGRGRPSPLIEPAPGGPAVVAIRLHRTGAELALVGLGHRVLARASRGFPSDDREPTAVFAQLAAWTRELSDDRPPGRAAIAVPGMVGPGDGRIASATMFDWVDVPGRELAREHFGPLPVELSRDAPLSAVAEYRYGAGRGAAHLLFLSCTDVGIGGALVDGDGLYLGSGYAMEVGHLCLVPGGRPCPCGARGCLQTYADSGALLAAAGLTGEPALAGRVLDGAEAGDAQLLAAVDEVARAIGAGLLTLVNLTSPDRIVLAGRHARVLRLRPELVTGPLRASVVARASGPGVVAAELPDTELRGAADLAFAPLLAAPEAAR